jgi:hypothetical protein
VGRCPLYRKPIVETATGPTAPAPAFHSDDVDQVADYRSISALAIVSLVIGLISPLCVLSPPFLVLALCGAAISLIALRRIALSDGRLAGRWAATMGLALCIASGVCAVTRNATVRYIRSGQAEEFAQNWLATLISNDTDRAFKLTMEGARPLPPAEPGMPPPETTPYEEFLKNDLVKSLLAAGKDAKIEFVETLDFTRQSQHDFFVLQRFRITPRSESAEAGAGGPIEVNLSVQRSRFRGGSSFHWLITRYEPAAANTHEH